MPAVIEAPPLDSPAPADQNTNHSRSRRRRSQVSAVELEIDGVAVKIARGADAGVMIAARPVDFRNYAAPMWCTT